MAAICAGVMTRGGGSARRMRTQRSLGQAGIGRRRQFRASQIGLEKFIGDAQAAAGLAIDEVVAAGEPEVGAHACASARLPIVPQIHLLVRVLANDLEEGIGAQRLGPMLRRQGAKLRRMAPSPTGAKPPPACPRGGR